MMALAEVRAVGGTAPALSANEGTLGDTGWDVTPLLVTRHSENRFPR